MLVRRLKTYRLKKDEDKVTAKHRVMTKYKVAAKHCSSEGGFTLIEMLIVLLVIGALLLMLVPNFMNIGTDAQTKTCEANKAMISAQVDRYYLENGHTYPSIDDLIHRGYLSEKPVCPLSPPGIDAYTISSSGEVSYVVRDR